ncbi:insulinase like protease [Cryptosporidium ryanae]|uniref:insulinase like protease n=1 Tax=Cryptosporidium ryanae TaxID=515981 RepID=UPI00351A9586|nr:insulinase like protease [Cryptosporidium ryanae]
MQLINLIFLIFFNYSVSSSFVKQKKQSTDFILRPFSDNRKFKHVILKNGLELLLIEDVNVEKSAYSVGVKAGSFNDPDNVFGLFHLIEHMLFLGTEKYPEPENYDEFMSQHGGSNNAFTSEERTIYFNEIGEEYLENGLKRFSRFFIDPIFDEKMIFKEINSVNSEHLKNIPNEFDRLWYTLKSYCYPPFSQFTTGNIDTLVKIPESKRVSLPTLLKKMYEKYYCGENMFFVQLSKRSIDEQEKLVKKYFLDISKNNDGKCKRNEPKASSNQKLIKDEVLGKIVIVDPLNNKKQLWFVWNFSTLLNPLSKQPLELLSYILNSKKKNTLYWYLQQNDLILNTNTIYESYSFGIIFIYQVELSNKGSSKKFEVIDTLFKYINKLKVSNKIMEVYSRVKEISEREFIIRSEIRDQSPMYVVSDICSKIVKYGAHNALSAEMLIEETDELLLRTILNTMTPQNTFFIAEDNISGKFSLTFRDEYYGVVHTLNSIPSDTLIKWKSARFPTKVENSIVIPIPKKCSPLNLRIVEEVNNFSLPELLNSNYAKIWWHKPITKNHRIEIKILLKYPRRYNKGVETQIWGETIVYLINLLMESEVEELNECGISVYLGWEGDGILIDIGTFGYSEDIEKLLNIVIGPIFRRINEIECESLKKIFKEFSESKVGFHENGQETAYSQFLNLIKSLQLNASFTEWELRQYLNKGILKQNDNYFKHRSSIASFISYLSSVIKSDTSNKICEMLNNWSYKILHRQSVISYVQGNITKSKTLKIIEGFIMSGNIEPLSEKYSMKKKVYKIKNSIDITLFNPNSEDSNNTVIMLYQFGPSTFEEIIHLMVLQPLIQGYLYENLRTKTQIGYIVLANIISICKIKSLVIGVEGNLNYSVEDIEKYIYNTLREFSLERLIKMKGVVFESIKTSLIEEINSIENSFTLSFYHYWDEIRHSGSIGEMIDINKAIEYINNRMTIQLLHKTFTKLIYQGSEMKANTIIKIIPNRNWFNGLEKKGNNKDEYINKILSITREYLKKNYEY